MPKNIFDKSTVRLRLQAIQRNAIQKGIEKSVLSRFCFGDNSNISCVKVTNRRLKLILMTLFVVLAISLNTLNSVLSIRCLLSSNYVVWEATRPLADCNYCRDVIAPIILRNITKQFFFENYAYSSKPIIIKRAISNWRAKYLNYNKFKKLYEQTDGSYESFDEGCQFLNFKTDLFTLKEVFSMSEARVYNLPGERPWYVGWSNCHPEILSKVRQYYDIPHFLPDDAEYPSTENIFLGYEIGAVMHLDYIPRLMWQAQVKGNKTWSVAPVPECDHICNKFQYYVEEGDILLLDTRLWYHSTRIQKGQISFTVQSEYG